MNDMAIIIMVIAIFAIPLIWFLGGILAKIFWGTWPLVVSTVTAGWIVWEAGLKYMVAIPAGLILGIIGNALWQRTSLFLSVDEKMGKLTLLD